MAREHLLQVATVMEESASRGQPTEARFASTLVLIPSMTLSGAQMEDIFARASLKALFG